MVVRTVVADIVQSLVKQPDPLILVLLGAMTLYAAGVDEVLTKNENDSKLLLFRPVARGIVLVEIDFLLQMVTTTTTTTTMMMMLENCCVVVVVVAVAVAARWE